MGSGTMSVMRDTQRLDDLRILIVDDEEDSRNLVAFILRDVGAAVEQAQDAQEAYEIVKRWSPDVIVSDIKMFDEDGYTFMKNIRAQAPREGGQIPAVAVTALSGEAVRSTALRSGYQDVVHKPVNSAELIAVIASLSGRQE
jgi:CheY-like chemotaxis protein